MTGVYSLSRATAATPDMIGHKAWGLVRMLAAGVNIPEGFVLSTEFFRPWTTKLATLAQWSALTKASADDLPDLCDGLKRACESLEYDAAQSAIIAEVLREHPLLDQVAIRSSSPDEDLGEASFAGAYETRLGVRLAEIEREVRRCFASVFHPRVILYKREVGLGLDGIRMAVIVQRQLVSDTAGVAFSVNPLNNDHDEILINANWGQGESVVSGAASPDCFIVQRASLATVDRQLGGKEIVLGLDPAGGLRATFGEKRDTFCLHDRQIRSVARATQEIEALYQEPVDIEWAFVGDVLFLLQARPVTTIAALAPGIATAVGGARRLYWDLTMTNHGIFDPLSRLGCSLIEEIVAGGREDLCGDRRTPASTDRLIVIAGGRLYADIANLAVLAGDDLMAEHLEAMDPLASRTVASLDLSGFDAGRIGRTKLLLRAAARMPRRASNTIRAFRHPRRARARWERMWGKHLATLEAVRIQPWPPGTMARLVSRQTMTFVLQETLILYLASRAAARRIRGLFENPSADVSARIDLMEQFLPGNVTMEMGFALHRLSTLVPQAALSDPERLGQLLADATMDGPLQEGWMAFLRAYGHRGPKEIDVAAPRFRERPELLIQELASFVGQGVDGPTPEHLFQEGQARRRGAVDELEAMLMREPRRLRTFRRLCDVVETLGGFRETHKFVVVHTVDLVRTSVLNVAERLVRECRLDDLQDVFHLELSDLEEAVVRPETDLRARVDDGRRASAIAGRSRNRSAVMDSRGRFYHAPRRIGAPGEIPGHAISGGTVRGRVKVLDCPTEKPLHAGEILVARATDPGWTPLFAKAGGIVLEIGGALQHGALVAREYGKPCVSGIQYATELFVDGEEVEVDGNLGVIRRLSHPASRPADPIAN